MHPRSLPSVDAVLSSPKGVSLGRRYPRSLVADAVRRALAERRRTLLAGGDAGPGRDASTPDAILDRAAQILDGRPARLRRVVNATGVVLHTNLGRAPLSSPAIEAIRSAAADPVALELDLETGARGERGGHVAEALCALTGAESALVVNNNAAALLLALDTLAARREVIVSRGEMIEIGGSFRLPDVLGKSGAILREVGTTNRTRIEDYAAAMNRRTALLLRAHPSNYRITGFTARPSRPELAALAREHGVPLLEDLGSGALVDLEPYGLSHEPTPREAILAGVDLVTFSGDKLLGGPQAGIAVGRSREVERMRANPLLRALRVDKLTLAGLGATLDAYRLAADPAGLAATIPTLGLLHRDAAALEDIANQACRLLGAALPGDFSLEVVPSVAEVGSGAQPTIELPSFAVAVAHASWPEERVAAYFRAADPPILGRTTRGRLLLDVRAVRTATDLVPRTLGVAEER